MHGMKTIGWAILQAPPKRNLSSTQLLERFPQISKISKNHRLYQFEKGKLWSSINKSPFIFENGVYLNGQFGEFSISEGCIQTVLPDRSILFG